MAATVRRAARWRRSTSERPSVSKPARIPRSLAGNASGSRSARIATYDAVHGPTPGIDRSVSTVVSRSACPVRSRSPSATRWASRCSVARRRPVSPIASSGATDSCSAVGKAWVTPSMDRSAPTGVPAAIAIRARERPRGSHRDLLTQHGSHRELESVDRAGQSETRRREDPRPQRRISCEQIVDRRGVGIQVEQPPSRQHDGIEVRRVVDRGVERHALRARGRASGRSPRSDPSGAHRSAERPAVERLDPGDRALAQECQERLERERRLVRQAMCHGQV